MTVDNLRHAQYGSDGIQIDDPQNNLRMSDSEIAATRVLVSGAGNLTVNNRDGMGRVTGFTEMLSGVTFTVVYGQFGPTTQSGGGIIRSYNRDASGLITSVVDA